MEIQGLLSGMVNEKPPLALERSSGGPGAPPDELSPEAEEFKRHIDDLKAQRQTAAMTLSLLQIVSRRFERAIFFFCQDETLVPLGAFGNTNDGRGIATLVRELVVAVSEGSIIEQALLEGRIIELDSTQLIEAPIMDVVGRPGSDRACILPLMSGDHAVALLYCDQGQRDTPLGELENFKPLLSQAARSFESVLVNDAT